MLDGLLRGKTKILYSLECFAAMLQPFLGDILGGLVQVRDGGSSFGCQPCVLGSIPNSARSACDQCPPGSFAPAGPAL
eukprot:2802880-Amphidinium_carterae.1